MQFSLYYAESCPFCQRVLQPLRHYQWPVTLCDILEPDHRNALINGGGRSTVPCLHIKDAQGAETWMYESLDILHLLQQHFLHNNESNDMESK